MRERLRTALLVVLAGVTISACGVAGFLIGHRTTENCDAALKVRDAMVKILVRGQVATQQTPSETLREEQRKQALAFYDRAIHDMNAVTCVT